MESCWKSMSETSLPSWVSGAPRNWGTAVHGKLSADQWNVIATIHLPFTLISTWGVSSASEREKAMLDNYMDMVRAIEIASLKITSPELAAGYTESILRYLRDFKTLFRDAMVKPVHHLALHYGDVLLDYGPTPGHQAQPYERYIHSFHQVPTNLKFGELESTLMRASGRSANLHALISDTPRLSSGILDGFFDVVQEVLSRDTRGTRLAYMTNVTTLFSVEKAVYSTQDASHGELTPDLHARLLAFLNARHGDAHTMAPYPDIIPLSRSARMVRRAAIRGIRYSIRSSAPNDSHIMFRPPGPSESTAALPGEIHQMFVHSHDIPTPIDDQHDEGERQSVTSLLLVVRPFKALAGQDIHLDAHFRRYGLPGGHCCYRDRGDEVLIDASMVICHAKTTLTLIEGRVLLHVKALDRLMTLATPIESESREDEEPGTHSSS
ncbi:hypothetical protein K488DRAFT_90960 [Vararia minispora EC-137]|uniref:Uncharacterized protein n=1 Tax=Vararia minispora EC-137 TaxID=1314806 RepID=A0ACB8Q6F7_9AGAM|nr:hypothetical protein K488DRAFT_90960 [Vararia minispora EC-137]